MSAELKVSKFDASGKQIGQIELSSESFDADKSRKLISDVSLMYLSNRKEHTAKVKSRNEVLLTGKKPWKQKGTGRARSGSARSPIWVGGGVAFGPKPRDSKYVIPKKLKQAAVRNALWLKMSKGNLMVVSDLPETIKKTKEMLQFLGQFGLKEKVLIVTEKYNRFFYLSARNLLKVAVKSIDEVSVPDFVGAEKILMTEQSFASFQEKLGL